MYYTDTTCHYCGKAYLRPSNRYNEAIKMGWNQYCSFECQYRHKDKRAVLRCFNIACNKIFKKKQRDIALSERSFCSKSCSATFYNRKRVEALPKKYCANPRCKKIIPRSNIYCSNSCSATLRKFPDDKYKQRIIKRIQLFKKRRGRIPFKKEMWGIYRPARRIFGSWNNTIIAAGFDPNPVKFARKHIAKDGHKCDSLAEKIIDDWLFKRNVPHEIHIPYNKYSMSADFKVNGFFIEFIGLQGELKAYDDALTRKEKMLEENNINVLKIYPQDLFPASRLDLILKDVLNSNFSLHDSLNN